MHLPPQRKALYLRKMQSLQLGRISYWARGIGVVIQDLSVSFDSFGSKWRLSRCRPRSLLQLLGLRSWDRQRTAVVSVCRYPQNPVALSSPQPWPNPGVVVPPKAVCGNVLPEGRCSLVGKTLALAGGTDQKWPALARPLKTGLHFD